MDDSGNPSNEKDGMEMIYIPAGAFLMGSLDSDSEAYEDEKPQHSVELDGYWIDQTPVTNAMFAMFVQVSGYKTEGEQIGIPINWRHPYGPYSDISDEMAHPVIYVSWNDALAYCRWVGRRLPSEAEWEKAARGTNGHMYPWGSPAPDSRLCNFYARRRITGPSGRTTIVGSFSPLGDSPYGCVDMVGNSPEWVADWYGKNYYLNSTPRNPKGPSSRSMHILRGGSWHAEVWDVRCARRFSVDQTHVTVFAGFRCAR